MSDNIVITGMGLASPIGCTEAAFWASLTGGQSGAAPVEGLDTAGLSRTIACQVRDPLNVPTELGRASQLAVWAARQAVAGAGLNPAEVPPGRIGVIVGTTMGETDFIEQRIVAPDKDWLNDEHLQLIARGKPGCIARNVQAETGAVGMALDLYGACAAGNLALATARRQLLDGRCDVVLAGGADGFSRLAFIGFMRLRIMAAEICRPFDQQRDGLFVGEGAGMFVLEREASARARGAAVRARISGSSITCENYHPTRPDPNGDGLSRATLAALAEAELEPAAIDYVCAHGTGTPQNDAIEVKMLDRCFPQGVAFSSIKALTGHTMGAAAALEAACCLLTLEQQTLVPTWYLENVLEPCASDAVRNAVRPGRVRHVLNNSAGFGGYNSSVVLSAA